MIDVACVTVFELPPEYDWASYRSRYPDLSELSRPQLREHWRQVGRRRRRNASTVETRQELLRCLRHAPCLLEIGPFDKPSLEFLRHSGQSVDYADYFSREEMVARARLYPERNPDAIPPIRYVLGNGGYGQINQRYHAVVSHHCVEHQPDLITHLLLVSRLLEPAGLYLFTMPDRRRCFDRFLPPSSLVDVLTAYLERRKRPPLQSLVEHKCFTTPHWRDGQNPLKNLRPDLRQLIDAALEEYQQYPYVDVHCWRFTSECFRRLLRNLVALSYLPASSRWHTYNFGNEFAVVLSFG